MVIDMIKFYEYPIALYESVKLTVLVRLEKPIANGTYRLLWSVKVRNDQTLIVENIEFFTAPWVKSIFVVET